MVNQSKEVHREYQIKRYHAKRKAAIELLGGKCVECGSIEKLEFDHIDPSLKEYSIDDLYDRKDLWDAEIVKCQLLCHDCHKKKHMVAEHGIFAMYKHHGCRCDPCVNAYREYQRNYTREYRRKNGRPSEKKIK